MSYKAGDIVCLKSDENRTPMVVDRLTLNERLYCKGHDEVFNMSDLDPIKTRKSAKVSVLNDCGDGS